MILKYLTTGSMFAWGLAVLLFMIVIVKMTFEKETKTNKNYNLSIEDFSFLIDLQYEMLNQDTVCQAAPRFWVVGGTRKVPTSSDYADGAQLICDTSIMANSLSEAVEHFQERIEDSFEDEDDEIIIEKEETYSFDSYKVIKLDKHRDVLYEQNYITTINELVEAMVDIDFIGDDEYSIAYYYNEHYRYPDTMFLTNRSCKEHIKANDYHYDVTAHSYAMTAWRSPEVEKLWNILDKIDWKSMKEDTYGAE
jgi:hypothetical protein